MRVPPSLNLLLLQTWVTHIYIHLNFVYQNFMNISISKDSMIEGQYRKFIRYNSQKTRTFFFSLIRTLRNFQIISIRGQFNIRIWPTKDLDPSDWKLESSEFLYFSTAWVQWKRFSFIYFKLILHFGHFTANLSITSI